MRQIEKGCEGICQIRRKSAEQKMKNMLNGAV